MTDAYTPPKVWTWNKADGGRFARINRPVAAPAHDKDLPVGLHPLQLHERHESLPALQASLTGSCRNPRNRTRGSRSGAVAGCRRG